MDEGTSSLDDILSGKEPEPIAEPVQQAEAPVEQPVEGPLRDEHGRFAPKTETGVETPAEEPEAGVPPAVEHPIPETEYRALKEERRKRQEAEARIAALEANFQAMQVRPTAPAEDVDFWENPQAVIGKQFQEFRQQLREELRQEQIAERIDASEAKARTTYADYDDAFHAFRQAAQTNPALVQQMTQSPDPADFAYKTGRRAMDLDRVGSIDEMIKVERAKWEEEARQAIQPNLAFPSSTVTERSVGQRRGPEWSGPTALGDILTP